MMERNEETLGKSADFPEDSSRLYERSGKMIVVLRHRGKLSALEERCPHRAGPLSEGAIRNGRITCPWHGAEFDIETGVPCSGPVKRALAKHEISERNGMVYLKVNPEAPT